MQHETDEPLTDELRVSAFVDGELGVVEAARVAALAAHCCEFAAQIVRTVWITNLVRAAHSARNRLGHGYATME